MIEKYVLNRVDLDKYINYSITNQPSDDQKINLIAENSWHYICEAHSNNYFLAKNVHQKVNNGQDLTDYLFEVWNLIMEFGFYMEEFDSKFIAFILRHISNGEIDLDLHLYELQIDYLNNYYGKQVCY